MLAGKLGQEVLGAVCSRLYICEYLARLEAVSPDVRECCLFSQTAPQRLDRFLETLSSDTNHPHRVFDERGGRIALRTPLLTKHFHVSLLTKTSGY